MGTRLSFFFRLGSSEDDNHTPEPEQYVRDYDPDEDSDEQATPAPAYNAYETTGWSDPSAGWTNEPAAWTAPTETSAPAANTSSIPVVNEPLANVSPVPSFSDMDEKKQETAASDEQEWRQEASDEAVYADSGDAGATVDGTQMVGKICRAVYAYQAQNEDELEVAEEEQLTIISASDQDWVTAQNVQGTWAVPMISSLN